MHDLDLDFGQCIVVEGQGRNSCIVPGANIGPHRDRPKMVYTM